MRVSDINPEQTNPVQTNPEQTNPETNTISWVRFPGCDFLGDFTGFHTIQGTGPVSSTFVALTRMRPNGFETATK